MSEVREPEQDREQVYIVELRIVSEDPDPEKVLRRVVEAIGRGTYADLLDTATVYCEDTDEEHELAEPTNVEQEAYMALLDRRSKRIEEIRSSLGELLLVP